MTRRFDPFRVLSRRERVSQIRALERVLEERDGRMDLANLRLETREAWIRPLETGGPRWNGPLDREAFRRAFYGRDRRPLDRRSAWLVALARSNESESFGVQKDHQRFMNGAAAKASRLQTLILVEEQYHARILGAACRTFGIDLEFQRPRWLMRAFIHATSRLPDAIRYIPILCGEAMATIVFARLRDTADWFADQPDVQEHLRALLAEITTDEGLHVAYCRARMGAVGLRLARLIAPLVVLGLLREVPRLRDIGLDVREVLRRLRRGVDVPAGCDWLDEGTDVPTREALAGV
jgi:hypothetical protein